MYRACHADCPYSTDYMYSKYIQHVLIFMVILYVYSACTYLCGYTLSIFSMYLSFWLYSIFTYQFLIWPFNFFPHILTFCTLHFLICLFVYSSTFTLIYLELLSISCFSMVLWRYCWNYHVLLYLYFSIFLSEPKEMSLWADGVSIMFLCTQTGHTIAHSGILWKI